MTEHSEPIATPRLLRLFAADRSAETQVAWLRVGMAAFALALIGATWRLWTPQDLFPQVPLIDVARFFPGWCDSVCLIAMLAALIAMLLAGKRERLARCGLALFAVGLAGSIVLDQHRLQPWAYQFLIVAAVLLSASPARAVVLLRLLTVSIYFHSAHSKLDHSFFHGHGQHLAEGFARAVGLAPEFWSEHTRLATAAMLPVGELLVAAGLCLPRVRRWSVCATVVMHAALLLALGPWGLDHKPGVLIWNVFFAAQTVLLFASPSKKPIAPSTSADPTPPIRIHSRGDRCATGLTAAVVLLPLLEPFGWFDHWPAWALYASRPERVRIYVYRPKVARLPEYVQPFVGPPAPPLGNNCPIRVDRWSLETLGVPVLPEVRFHVGVALALAWSGPDDQSSIDIKIDSAADRWTGKRSTKLLAGEYQLNRRADQFYLNARPRKTSSESR